MAATVLSSKQSGQKLVASADLSDTVTITAVDTSKSILLYSYRVADAPSAGGTRLVGTLTNSTTITFEKDSTGDDIIVEWKVIEFSSGVFVQHIYSTASSSTIDTAVTAVDTAKTFVLYDGFWEDGTYTRSTEKIQAWLTSTTNLRIRRGSGTTGQRAVAQVVQVDNATVQTGETVLTALSDTVTITAVTTGKAFAINGASDDIGNNVQGADDWGISADLTNSTTITFTRYGNSRDMRIRWYAVELSDADFSVQRGAHTFTSAAAENVTLTAIDQNASVAVMGGQGHYHARNDETDTRGESYPGSAASNKITSSTNLEVQVDGWDSGDTTVLDWQVLEFPSDSGRIHDFMPFFANMITGV